MTTEANVPAVPDYKSQLEAILRDLNCDTGTLHRSSGDGEFLELVCQIGVPESMLPKITTIPFGKGIAGVAAVSREPVELCNLQQDLEGVALPEARRTGIAGSIAVPVLPENSDRVLGTLGVGKHVPHTFNDYEKKRLAAAAADIALQFQA